MYVIFSFSALIYVIFTLGALNWKFPVDLFPGGVGLYIFSEISGKIVLKQRIKFDFRSTNVCHYNVSQVK